MNKQFLSLMKCGQIFMSNRNRPFSVLTYITKEFNPSACRVEYLPDNIRRTKNGMHFAIVIRNVLRKEECDKWINDTEQKGYSIAGVNLGGGKQSYETDVRKGSRFLTDDTGISEQLWERISPLIPKGILGNNYSLPTGLNERLRFLRYDAGDFFALHNDGAFTYPEDHPKAGLKSYVTFQLYLNDGFEGGATRIYSDDRSEFHDVVPEVGSVLLFQHEMFHSGEPVRQGRKYTVRTDMMFID